MSSEPHIWILEWYCAETREWLPYGLWFFSTKRAALTFRRRHVGQGIRLRVRKYVRETKGSDK